MSKMSRYSNWSCFRYSSPTSISYSKDYEVHKLIQGRIHLPRSLAIQNKRKSTFHFKNRLLYTLERKKFCIPIGYHMAIPSTNHKCICSLLFPNHPTICPPIPLLSTNHNSRRYHMYIPYLHTNLSQTFAFAPPKLGNHAFLILFPTYTPSPYPSN